MMLEEIDCPGDTIAYNCSIESNTEDLHLTWSVVFPEGLPIEKTYHALSRDYEEFLDMEVSAMLVDFKEGYIQSSIRLVVTDSSMNGTIVTCGIDDLDVESVVITLNTSS